MNPTSMLNYYWKNGVPSIVLAVLTLLLCVISVLRVQPQLESRYASLISSNLETLKVSKPTMGQSTYPEISHDAGEESEVFEQSHRLLEETRLCLQRLVYLNNRDQSLLYQLASVWDAISELDRKKLDQLRFARQPGVSGSHPQPSRKAAANLRELEAKVKSSKQQARTNMERVQKLAGAWSDRASLWILQQELTNNTALSTSELRSIIDQLEGMVVRTEKDSEVPRSDLLAMKELLVQAYVECASSPSKGLSLEERMRLIEKARQAIAGVTPKSTSGLLFAAESLVVADPQESRNMALKATQSFWALRGHSRRSLPAIRAAFQAMLLLENLEEAGGFLNSQLQSFSKEEHASVQEACSEACVRRAIGQTIESHSKRSTIQVKTVKLLDIALRINPSSKAVLDLLETLVDEKDEATLGSELRKAIGSDGNQALAEILLAYDCAESESFQRLEQVTRSIVKKHPIHGQTIAGLASRSEANQLISTDASILWMKHINSNAPQIPLPWSVRANLHIKKKELVMAIECLRHLLEIFPNDKQLHEAIADIQAMIESAPEDSSLNTVL